jgi:hypothetical protein
MRLNPIPNSSTTRFLEVAKSVGDLLEGTISPGLARTFNICLIQHLYENSLHIPMWLYQEINTRKGGEIMDPEMEAALAEYVMCDQTETIEPGASNEDYQYSEEN